MAAGVEQRADAGDESAPRLNVVPRPLSVYPEDLVEGTPQWQHYDDHITLQHLMLNATNAEEAAIRPISPAFGIIFLSGGNIASRGNTSCLLQDSRLGLILPHLPENCRIIIVKQRNTVGRMRSTKYKRSNIQLMLHLLHKTGHPAWRDIQVSSGNLEAWDEDGDLDVVVSESLGSDP